MIKKITLGIFLAASIAQADIYDDYKLLAESILTNSAKIEELAQKLSNDAGTAMGSGLGAMASNAISVGQVDYQAQIDALKSEVELLKKNSVLGEELRSKLMSRLHGE
ncbi:MAG: hypothetical protein AB7U24_06755 [Sulfurimonadaceae bacterium]